MKRSLATSLAESERDCHAAYPDSTDRVDEARSALSSTSEHLGHTVCDHVAAPRCLERSTAMAGASDSRLLRGLASALSRVQHGSAAFTPRCCVSSGW